jgi:hypothetical protein
MANVSDLYPSWFKAHYLSKRVNRPLFTEQQEKASISGRTFVFYSLNRRSIVR